MAWYSASLLFKSTHLIKANVSPLWEERIILIKATSEEDAKSEGLRIGKEAEHEYAVLLGDKQKTRDRVKWTFEQIERVHLIDDENVKDRTELFSRYLRDSEVKSMLTPFED